MSCSLAPDTGVCKSSVYRRGASRLAGTFLASIAIGAAAIAAESARAGNPDDADWLRKHSIAWPVDEAAPLPALPARIRNARVILLGEVHGIAHGQILDFAFLRSLHRDAGVRLYLGEFDAAQADAFNEYLNGGEDAAVDAVFAGWRARGAQWASADFRRKLSLMAAWNQSLPERERIRFLGADEIQDTERFCLWLAARLDRAAPMPAVKNVIAALRDPPRCAAAGASEVATLDVSTDLDPVTRDALAAWAVNARHADRESRIEANVRRHLATHRGVLYGLWGLYHVVQAEVNGTAPLALRLARADVPVRTAVILNLAGEMMIPTAGPEGGIAFSTVPYTVDSADAALVYRIEPFATAAAGPLTLFDLSRRGSPYRGSDALTRVGGRFGEMQPFVIDPATALHGFWTDAVVISRGSLATQPVP